MLAVATTTVVATLSWFVVERPALSLKGRVDRTGVRRRALNDHNSPNPLDLPAFGDFWLTNGRKTSNARDRGGLDGFWSPDRTAGSPRG